MPARISLPRKSEKDDLVRVLDNAVAESEAARNPHAVEWLINHWFLLGARGFNRLNYLKGTIDGHLAFEDRKGRLRFKYEAALQHRQTVESQLINMDLSPAVTPKPFSLDAQRRAAAAKILFQNIMPRDKVEEAAILSERNIIDYGIAGIMPEFDIWPDGSTSYSISVIPPWELGCMPCRVDAPSEAAAILRSRWVSLDWLEDQPQFRLPRGANRAQLKAIDVTYGTTPNRLHSPSRTSSAAVADALRSDMSAGSGRRTRMSSPHVKLVEMWQKGPHGPAGPTLKRYVAKVGDIVIKDRTFGDEAWASENPGIPFPPPFPIGISNWYPVGFWGRAFLSPIVTVTNEVEESLSAYFGNMRKFDTLSALLVPGGMGLDMKRLKHQDGMAVITFEPDPLSPDARPLPLQPVNSGAAPAQAAQLALNLAREAGGHAGPVAGQFGRMDSQNAIESALTIQQIPLSTPAKSLADAFAQVYRAILYEARIRFTPVDKLELLTIEDALAGLKIGKDGSIELDPSGIPWPHQVQVSVRNASPDAKIDRQREALEGLMSGTITPTQFWILNFTEELGYMSGANRAIRGQVQTGRLNNLTLFNDGESPGSFVFNPVSDNPNILLEIVNDFMAQDFWKRASVEVREAFESYKKILVERVGGEFPEQAQPAEQAAAQHMEMVRRMQEQMAQMQQQGQGAPRQQ